MHLPAEVPKLSKLPFIIGDVALFSIVGLIAWKAPNPFAGGALIAMTCCGTVGALLLAVPFVVNYGRKTDALLSDRQDQIAALAQTTAASAEQVSIAAVGLQSIAEVSARTAKTLETLPLKLQEKIAEFKAQLNEVNVTENVALEEELQTLRTAETDRLQSTVDELAGAAKDLGRLEALVRTHAASAQESAATLNRLAAEAGAQLDHQVKNAATAARTELETTFAHLRSQLQADIAAAQSQSIATWNGRVSQALGDIDQRLEAFSRRLIALTETAARQVEQANRVTPASVDTIRPSAKPIVAETPAQPARVAEATIATPVASLATPAPTPPPAPTPAPASSVPSPTPVRVAPLIPPPVSAPAAAPTALSPDKESDDDDDHEDDDDEADETTADDKTLVEPADDEDPFAAAPAPKTKAKPAPVPSFAELDLDLPPPTVRPAGARSRQPAGPPAAPTPSADGATRLVVTAYIGIGNKLYVRGSGPGLSWDKGVPLQFVSIGKWRWDTPASSTPVAIKLYKNDQVECTTVGTVELEPGHHHEVTATF